MEITTGRIPSALKVVVYGPEGIGKSTLAAQFPNPLFIDTEGSTRHMDVRRLPAPGSWLELLEAISWAIAHADQMGTLVLDTADWAEILCTEHVCARNQKGGVEDFGYGKGYTYVAEEFGRAINALDRLREKGVHIVVNAHAKMRKFEQPDEMGAYDRWEMKLSRQVAPMLKEWADMVLFASYKTIVVNVDGQGAQKGRNKAQGGARVLRTTHHPCWDAKNRFDLPEELPLKYDYLRPLVEQSTPGGPPQQTAPLPQAAPAAPIAAPAQAAPPISPAPPAQPSIELPPDIPAPLARLMREAEVAPDEVKGVIAGKGFYPFATPWNVIAQNADFLNGWLLHPNVWPKIVDAIRAERENTPF